jgi:hypothetical protein
MMLSPYKSLKQAICSLPPLTGNGAKLKSKIDSAGYIGCYEQTKSKPMFVSL